MNKRLKYFFIAVFVLLAIAIVVSIMRKGGKKEDQQSGFGSIMQKPTIPDIIENPPIEVGDKAIDKFPSKLPTIKQKIAVPLSDETIRKTAANLGFSSEPIIAQDAKNGPVYIWNSQTNSLVATQKLRSFKYVPSSQAYSIINNAQNKQLSQDDRVSIAKNFLIDNFPIDTTNIDYVNTIYLKIGDNLETYQETNEAEAQLYRLNFSPKFEDLGFITLNPQKYLYSLDLLKNGEVLNANLIIPSELAPSQDSYNIKTSDEIKTSITEAKIVSINSGNVNLYDLQPKDLGNIEIASTQISYLYDDVKSLILQPIFILKGNVPLSGEKNKVEVILYLPAINGN